MEERENQSLHIEISSREYDKTNKEKTKHILQQL